MKRIPPGSAGVPPALRLVAWWSLLSLLSLLSLSVPVAAQSLGELRTRANALSAEANSPASAEAERRAIAKLGEISVDFIQIADKATLSGDPGAQGGELRSTYEAISKPLEATYQRANDATEVQVQKIIAEDGDLEALYDSPKYKEAQQTGAQALYFLNWLHYYGARLYEGDTRKRLLAEAQKGFSDFTGGEETSELTVESLLGRGLCALDSGDFAAGIQDLEAVSNSQKASPERREKARLALLDAYVRRGDNESALKLSDTILKTASGPEADYVRYLRVRALLNAAKKNKAGGQVYRQEAMLLMDRLRRSGGAWENRVTALMQSEIDDPEEWKKSSSPFAKWQLAKMMVQKEDFAGALPLLTEVVASDDKSLEAVRPEASYLLGLAQFKANKYPEAAASLERSLQASKPTYGAEAAYLRFKAMEAIVASKPEAADPVQYENALRGYLDNYPDHKFAFEAHYRLGELLQAQHKFRDALKEYAAVKGDPGFELQARFATVQCNFELFADAPPDERKRLLEEVDTGLQRFAADTKSLDRKVAAQVPLAQMQAKAAIMRAVHLKLQPKIDDAAIIATLTGFEERAQDQPDLLLQAAKLRLEAYQRTNNFSAAREEIQKRGTTLAKLDARTLEELAVGFIRAGAHDKSANEAAQPVALAIYELIPTEGGAAGRSQLTLARLYENTGDRTKAAAIYQQVLQEKAGSLAAVRGLARIAEADQKLADAAELWRKLGTQVRPGDPPWYESSYEVARLTKLQGNKADACKQLTALRPAMPGLTDQDLRSKLTTLYSEVCD